ncbi:aldehyde dehydrogenase family protein [Acidovorax sp. Be4]|jgi:aldehyde dehydrogenase (NAD+)|uniref:Aldehyde dehydrogenase family protein n=1 Tax=Acidovorax bellezanensis TaxID=2976702 RepID=A0ABT2PVJ6_9BURK|nr:aldehyde dehydrogenase family protein [Acidovorax sp. Be4]MCT9813262.1 aldehyde dehydrogenase family protein [Acidovorax sp. Be4]
MTATVQKFLNYIDGKWLPCQSGRSFDNTNPADTDDIVGQFQASGSADAEAAVAAAQKAFDAWRKTPIGKRAKILNDAALYLEQNVDQFAQELTREEGKALAQAKDEFLRSAQTFRFYATEGQTCGGETYPQDDPHMHVFSHREPLGVVTVISPWNFPASIPARKLAPALITGNTVVFKPSSDAPLSGLRLVEALEKAGIPAGVVNCVTGRAGDVGPVITTSNTIRAISFTGSTVAGTQIHRSVHLTTRLQMELGGKNPLIVMEDADLDHAVDLAIKGGFSLTGQACTGTSRIIVVPSVKAVFTEKLLQRVAELKIGPGMTPGMDLGPLATEKQMQTVLKYVDIGKQEARWLCGGERLSGPGFDKGYYVSPAVFTDVTPRMRIAQEEIFGPVLAIIEAADFNDALAKANDTEYGLSASLVTMNPRYMHIFTNEIQAGTVKINRTTTGNLVNAPFGGIKNSSTSTFRESGRAGLDFFTQIKTVYRGV